MPPQQKRLLILLGAVGVVSTHWAVGEWNDQSRMATVQSLVESGTLVIDDTAFVETGDKVYIGGHFYSDKPPMASVLGAIVYLPLYTAGLSLQRGRNVAYYLVTLLTVKLFWILGTLAFFLGLRHTGLDAQKRFFASLVLAFGSLYFTWSVTFNNHGLAASCLSIGFFFLLQARYEGPLHRSLGLAAVFFSLAGTIDMPTSIFGALFFGYVLWEPKLRPAVATYVLPFGLVLSSALAMNWSIHGSIKPVNIVRAYFEYPGSPWIGAQDLSGMEVHDAGFVLSYSALALVGPRGFLVYNPFAFVALWGVVRTLRAKAAFFREAVVISTGSGVLVVYYFLTTNNYGGWSYSIRWFVPLLPLMFFFLYPYFEALSSLRGKWFRALLAASVFIALVGAIDPWTDETLSDVSLLANLKELSLRVGKAYRAKAVPLLRRAGVGVGDGVDAEFKEQVDE